MSANPSAVGALMASEAHFVVVEDDLLFRELLIQVISIRFAPRSLHAFADGPGGLAHCLAAPPDLLLTDIRLPGMDGREVIRRVRAAGLNTRIVVLTQAATPTLPSELISLGVAGFVDKASSLDQVERAIDRVLAGGLFFSANIGPSSSPFPALSLAKSGAGPNVLTERQVEVARLVAAGLYSKEIGERLQLSPRTIEKERVVIMERIGVRDLPGLIRWCVQHGLA